MSFFFLGFLMLNHPSSLRVNTSWPWYNILCQTAGFDLIMLYFRFSSVFIDELDLQFYYEFFKKSFVSMFNFIHSLNKFILNFFFFYIEFLLCAWNAISHWGLSVEQDDKISAVLELVVCWGIGLRKQCIKTQCYKCYSI